MKIGHLISNYFPSVGGAQVFVHELSNKIIESGYKATVVTPARGGSRDKDYKYEIVRLNPLINRLLFMNFSAGKAYLENILRKLHKRYGFDVWQATVGYPLGAAAVDFFNSNRIPCVLRCAGEDIQILPGVRYGYRLKDRVDAIARENYKKFTALVTASDGMKKDLLSLGVPSEKIHVIPNGVDCARFGVKVDRNKIRSALGAGSEQKLIISVGRNHPKKGFEYIPEIIKRLLKKGAKFRWLLVGKDCESIRSLAVKEGVGEYLIVREVKPGVTESGEPDIPNNTLIQYYKASDIFAFPTLIELFAKVLIEAMAAGLPIVTTNAPGADDIIRHNENGLKNKTGDMEGMTESILSLLSDGALAKRLGGNASRDAKDYDWSIITEKYIRLYERISKVG